MNLLNLCEILVTSNMYDRAQWALMDAQGHIVEVYWRIEGGVSKWKVVKGRNLGDYAPLATLPAMLAESGISEEQLATEVHKKVLSLAVSATVLINRIEREVGAVAVQTALQEHQAFVSTLLRAIKVAQTISKPRLSIVRSEE